MNDHLAHYGEYEVEKLAARGGIARVYVAHHRGSGVKVALKVLRKRSVAHQVARASFLRERDAGRRLVHPGVVRLLDEAAPDGGGPTALVLEWADGEVLRRRDFPWKWPRVRHIVSQLLETLAYVHAQDVLHLDIKPGNILYDEETQVVRLLDFGSSLILGSAFGDDHEQAASVAETGTPSYMAPEQFFGDWRKRGPWTDLYSVGVMVWTMLAGAYPFEGAMWQEVAEAHLTAPIPALPEAAEVPPSVERWIRRLMAKAPVDRFARAADALALMPSTDAPLREEGKPAPTTAMLVGQDPPTREHPVSGVHALVAGLDSDMPPLPNIDAALELPPRLLPAPLIGLHPSARAIHSRLDLRRELWSTLERVIDTGRCHTVLVRGEQGSGKTRLTDWISRRAEELGVGVALRAWHDPFDSDGSGLRGAICRHLRCQGLDAKQRRARVAAMHPVYGTSDPQLTSELVELLRPSSEPWNPDRFLRQLEGKRDQVGDSFEESVRLETSSSRYRTILSTLRVLSNERTLVIRLDDAHRAAETLGFLRYLSDQRGECGLRALIVATINDEEIEDFPSRRALLDDLAHEPRVSTLELTALSRDQRRTALEESTGLATRCADSIASRTDTIHAAVGQLETITAARQIGWTESGELCTHEQSCESVEGWSDSIQQAVADARADVELRRRKCLGLVALLGHFVEPALFHKCAEHIGLRPPADLFRRLVDAHVLIELDGAYKFTNADVHRDAVVYVESCPWCAELHMACARTLEKSLSDTSPWRAARAGAHYLGAGALEQGARTVVEALIHAYGIPSPEDLTHLEATALTWLEPFGQRARAWRLSVRTAARIAEHRLTGASSLPSNRIDALIEAADQLDQPLTAALTRLAGVLALIDEQDLTRAIPLAREAIERVGRNEPHLLALAHQQLARALHLDGQFDEAESAYRRTHALFSAIPERPGLFRLLRDMVRLYLIRGNHAAADRLVAEMMRRGARSGRRMVVADAFELRGELRRQEGRYRESRNDFSESTALWAQLDPARGKGTLLRRGLLELCDERPKMAARFFDRAASRLNPDACPAPFAMAMVACALIAAHTSDWKTVAERLDDAEPHFDRAVRFFELGLGEAAEQLGDLARQRGEEALAKRAYAMALTVWEACKRQREADMVRKLLAESSAD